MENPNLILTDLTGDGIVHRAHEEHYEKENSESKDIVQIWFPLAFLKSLKFSRLSLFDL